MSRKALKVVVELEFSAVSCPGVHLPYRADLCLRMKVMGQLRQTDCLPPLFPLIFCQKMTFEKVFRRALDPGDLATLLQREMVRVELLQLIPPDVEVLAFFEEDARRFLFPEPRLVPSFSGVDREVLMTRSPYFPGIAPRLEFSTRTTILECSADAQTNIYPNQTLVEAPNRRSPSVLLTLAPQGGGANGGHTPTLRRSRSLSPPRAGGRAGPAHWDITTRSQCMMSSWPGTARPTSLRRPSAFTSFSLPPPKMSSTEIYPSSAGKPLMSSTLLSRTTDELDSFGRPRRRSEPSLTWQSYRKHARRTRCQSGSHREWEEIQDRVRGLLTTARAVRRLNFGATPSEVDDVLCRRSISPGPP